MCTGIELMMIAGAAVSAVGTVSAGAAAKERAGMQAQIMQQQAAREKQIGRINAKNFRAEQSAAIARDRAARAASGVHIGEGSALLVSQKDEEDAEIGALQLAQNGVVASTRLQQQAQLQRMQGQSALTGSVASAGGSLLMAGSKVKWPSSGPGYVSPGNPHKGGY